MIGSRSISIWFFIGTLLLIYGVIILIANVADYFWPSTGRVIVLEELHFGIWWGLLLIAIGTTYFVSFRPWKKK